jgi:uncharacterized protein (TIGR00369 family)
VNEELARRAFESALQSYRQEFNTFFLARLYGMEISYDEETCSVSMPVLDFMFNPQGSLHGGVIATLLDISMGHLLKRQVGAGATLEMSTQFLRSAREGQLTATSRFQRKGRQICFMRSEAIDAGGALIATSTSTWKVL